MTIEELFQAIENICGFDGSISLLDRIRETLRIHEEPEKESIKQNALVNSEKSETNYKFNPFYIEKSDQVIHAETEKDFSVYKWKILDFHILENFVEKHKGKVEIDIRIKLVSKMIETIKKIQPGIQSGEKLIFHKDKDNSEKLAKYVKNKILENCVKKISTLCYEEICEKKNSEELLLELVDVIHTYLKNLGVYTVVTQVGIPYEEVINFYELIYDQKKGNKHPIITQVIYPAYIIDYLDEDEERQSYCVPGRCIGE